MSDVPCPAATAPPASQRALAWAWDAILAHGEAVDMPGELVRVPLAQSELARIEGCSAGTIAWYLRCLGPAVQHRRGGIVFDRRLLAQLDAAHHPPTVTGRTAAVAEAIIAAFGCPTPDGAGVELVCNGRPASLADLGEHLGLTRSSTYRHLVSLERAGRLQRRSRRLYVVPTPGPDGTGPLPPGPTDAAEGPTPAHHAPREEPMQPAHDIAPVIAPHLQERALRLLEGVAQLLAEVTSLARELVEQASPGATSRATGAQGPRVVGAHSPAASPVRAAPPAGFSVEVDLIDEIDVEITSGQSPLRAGRPRATAVMRANPSRAAADWSEDDLPELLRPLLEECRRCELPGVTDPARVARSLTAFSAEEVRSAARQMAADLRSGAPMRSPIAVLVRKAEAGDPYYFPVPAEPPPPVIRAVAEERQQVDDEEAVAAVAGLGASQLAQLDKAVAAHLVRLLGGAMAKTALAAPATLAHWRPVVWRAVYAGDGGVQ